MDNIPLAIVAIVSSILFIVLAGQLAVLRVQRELDGKINGKLTLTLLGLIPLIDHNITGLTGAKVVLDPNNEKACDVELIMPEKTYRMQNVYFGRKKHHEKIVERIQSFINDPNGELVLSNPSTSLFLVRLSLPIILLIASIAWLVIAISF